MTSMSASSHKVQPSVLMVGNFAPGAGYAWWLMEHFWRRLGARAQGMGLVPRLAFPELASDHEGNWEMPAEKLVVPDTLELSVWEVMRAIRRRQVKVLYLTDRRFCSLPFALYRLAGVRCIIVHDHAPGDRSPVGGVKGLIKSLLHRVPWLTADIVLAVSPLIAQRAVRTSRISQDRVVVVQNGIQTNVPAESRDFVRSQLGIERHSYVCVTVARAHPYKRVVSLLDLAEQCARISPDVSVRFVHCGDGPQFSELQTEVERRGLRDRVLLLGKRSDVPSVLSAADFAFHPSQGEAFSLAILEYMRAGLPVVVPDIPTVCQAVVDGQSGLIYPDAELSVAAQRIMQMLGDPPKFKMMGACARKRVENHFSLEKMNADFDAAIDTVFRRVGISAVTSGRSSE
jgi:glycosyltransferase involved in cell wall biosynthesis